MSRKKSTDDLLRLASRLEGQRLVTAARGAAFIVNALPDGIEVVPASTDRPRKVGVSTISRFLEEHNTSGVQRPGHYQDITFDASYLLTILAHAEATAE